MTTLHAPNLVLSQKLLYKKTPDHSLTNTILVTKYFTNTMIHQSGKFQQTFWAKADKFNSSDKILDILKHIYAEFILFKYKNL